MRFCLLFIRSILLILVFWVNFDTLDQPVIVVCLSMRSRWGKERGIGDKIDEKNVKILKNVFFTNEFIKEIILRAQT